MHTKPFASCTARTRLARAALAGAGIAATSGVAEARPAPAYQSNFEASVVTAGSEWTLVKGPAPFGPSTPTTSQTTGFTRFLGNYCNDIATLTLGLTKGQAYDLKFDLYIIDSWDGNSAQWGPDRVSVAIDGATKFSNTFTNTPQFTQTYGATPDVQWVDLGFGTANDSIYRNVTIRFTAGSTSTRFDFSGSGLQNAADESWGLDNLSVTQVPAPGAAIGLVGAAGVAGLRRRRR